MRVYELAKELGKTSKEIVSLLHELGVPVSSAANTLDDQAIVKIREEIQAAKNPAAKLIKKPKEEGAEGLPPVIMIKTETVESAESVPKEEEIKQKEAVEVVALAREPVKEESIRIYVDDTYYDYSAAIADAFQQAKK